jgi:hypothetical protein
VSLKLLGRQAEVAIFVRQRITGMVGDQHQAAIAGAVDDLEWWKDCRSRHFLGIGWEDAEAEFAGAVVIP